MLPNLHLARSELVDDDVVNRTTFETGRFVQAHDFEFRPRLEIDGEGGIDDALDSPLGNHRLEVRPPNAFRLCEGRSRRHEESIV